VIYRTARRYAFEYNIRNILIIITTKSEAEYSYRRIKSTGTYVMMDMQQMLYGNINIVTSDVRVIQICIFIGHYIGRKCNRQPKLNVHWIPIKVIFCQECVPSNKQSLLRILLKIINGWPMNCASYIL
jgi:hypothetical protein